MATIEKKTNNWSKRSHANTADIAMSADSLNCYFAGIATDPNYSADAISDAVRNAESLQSQSRDNISDFHPYSADHIAIVLHHTANTAPGPGGIPAWVYKTLAAQISGIVSKLINYSISQSLAPIAWRCAHITPVAKTNPVTGPSDFRPISVTPILSRLTERLIVHDYLLPCLKPELFCDQYAYKPTGSTTCALIDFTHRIHTMLENNNYVRCVFIDFSRAFDTIDHLILIRKLTTLQVPIFIIKWLVSFLSDRTQTTCLNYDRSASARITRSIIQGSGVGPILYIMFAFDLKPLDLFNILLKYADDSTLLCPENTGTSVELEMAHIIEWSKTNKLLLNLLKTKEMVFHRPNPRRILFPDKLQDIERVSEFKLLGVLLQTDLRFNDYVSALVTVCNQRLYLLTQLKKQGLKLAETDNVFKSIILTKLIYALPMLFGYLTDHQIEQINSVFRKARKWQLTIDEYDIVTIAEKLRYDLFQQSKCITHCINHLYTPTQNTSIMGLRQRGHNFFIPSLKYVHNSKGFLVQCLQKYR